MSKICQLFSGSSGNSIYIGCGKSGILVDAGTSAKRITDALSQREIDIKSISALFLTHEHTDHASALRVLCSRNKIPVYTNAKSFEKLNSMGCLDGVQANVLSEEKSFSFFNVKPFEQSHDSEGCNGFVFTMQDGRRIGICTDTGYITPQAEDALIGCDAVFLESNYERSMLDTGPYPYPLKKRIAGDNGHLSNADCGEFSKTLISNGTTRLILSHLSRENNLPEIARQNAVASLCEIGAKQNSDYRLYVSKPVSDEGVISL